MKAITDIIRACGKGFGFIMVAALEVAVVGYIVRDISSMSPEQLREAATAVAIMLGVINGPLFSAGIWKRIVDKRQNGNGVTVLPMMPGEATHATRESVGG